MGMNYFDIGSEGNEAQRLRFPAFHFPMNIFTFYLSHASKSRHYVRKWEIEFEGRHPNIALLNPFYDVIGEGREDIRERDEGRIFTKEPGYNWRLVTRDLSLITVTRGLLTIIDDNFDVSVGTPMETVYGRMLANNPKLCVCNKRDDLIEHPWIQTHYHKVYPGFEEFERDVENKVKEVKEEWGF